MTRLRIILLVLLFLMPFLVLMGLGAWYMKEAHILWVWWPLLSCMGLAYLLAWRWTRRNNGVLPPVDRPPPGYWTDRDKLAWERVEAKARSYETVTLDQLSNARHFTDLSLELATEVGKVYNPESEDPFDSLTLPEVLACVELASAEMNEMAQKYIPGVHLLRIRDVRRAKTAYGWYKTGQDLYWAGAVLFDPIQAGLRFLASRKALGNLMDRVQSNVILWFHTTFIHELGRYLIELNSGRLKVGVKRYREILAAHQEPPVEQTAAAEPAAEQSVPVSEAAPTPAEPATKTITIAVLGAVKAGKSSLANALLEKQSAPVDRLPVPSGIRYDLVLPGGQPVSLFDSSGYGEDGVSDADFTAAVEASRDADLILLVTPALVPGRVADVDLLDRLKAWFSEKPHLRMPPVLVVVNQVDLLSPKAEWSPPYQWKTGTRPKEANIRECLEVVREQFGPRAAAIVPTCARHGETFGIVEGLVKEVGTHLDHARGAAILKAFDAAASERPIGQVVDQVGNVAKLAWDAVSGLLSKKK
jgi:predicted GTPase